MKLESEPVSVSAKQAAQYMVGKKRLLVITGAGISAASGIPTFRGEGGLWTNDAKDAMGLLT
jgi:NAD-dependent SIR2 family protein deacetylase